MIRNALMLASVTSLLTACASTGVKIEQSKLAQLHKGETTYSEAIGQLGKPTQVIMPGDGTKTIMYVYASAQARPETFIPIAGAFVGGMDTENSVVSLRFDRNDVLQNITSSQGAYGTGTGFEANTQPRNSAQPKIVE